MSEIKCTLTDAELLDAVQKWVSKLCYTGGSAWTLSVPVDLNRDPDILITELCCRYNALEARHNALREAVEWMLYIDTPENFEGGKHIKARAEVDRLLQENL